MEHGYEHSTHFNLTSNYAMALILYIAHSCPNSLKMCPELHFACIVINYSKIIWDIKQVFRRACPFHCPVCPSWAHESTLFIEHNFPFAFWHFLWMIPLAPIGKNLVRSQVNLNVKSGHSNQIVKNLRDFGLTNG